MTLIFGAKKWFAFVISILLITNTTILLDIQFVRPILGFFFITLLPGLLILEILKLNKIESTEKFVLSVGLSISFLMLFGLLLNNLSLSLGYEKPLATIPLLISFNLAFVLSAVVAYKLNKDAVFSLPNFKLSTSEKAFLIVPLIFPALSIFGMHMMNTTDSNIILLFLLSLIPIYVVFICFFNRKVPGRVYPVVIFLISISLLLIFMLRFPHIYGHDVHTEYYLFQMTLDNLHWCVLEHITYDACLSISLLPTIYQSILNINLQEYLFKGVYVSICSFTPLAIYVTSKRYIGELYAFLASFFFISQISFLQVAGNTRTNVAVFFVALAVMILFNDKITPFKRKILFIIFMISIIVSHYSSTYVFFFTLCFSWFAITIFLKRYAFKRNISLRLILLFSTFIFFWYSQVTEESFNFGVKFIRETVVSLNEFFIEESRETQFTQLLGQELAFPIISKMRLAVTWGTFVLIGIGVFTMIKRYKEMGSIANVNLKKQDFLKTKFQMEYLVMVLACAGLLILMVALPYVSTGYGIQRLYSLMTVILSVCFVIGGITLANFSLKQKTLLNKQKQGIKGVIWEGGENASQQTFKKSLTKSTSKDRAYLIILLILIPYFMFQTGVMYHIFGAPVTATLRSEGEEYELEYTHDSESCAAKWLATNGEKKTRIFTADVNGGRRLISQGRISPRVIWSRSFFEHAQLDGYVYLSHCNVINDSFVIDRVAYNTSEYSDRFIKKSKIYNSGGSDIYGR